MSKPRRELMRCPCCTHWVLTQPDNAGRADRVQVFVLLTPIDPVARMGPPLWEEVTGVSHAG